METKLTYSKILNANEIFTNQLAEIETGVKVGLYVIRNIDFLSSHVQTYRKMLKKLFERYGQMEEGSTELRVPPEKQQEFQQELQELLETEIDIEYTSISSEELEEIEEITPRMLFNIKYTIEDL